MREKNVPMDATTIERLRRMEPFDAMAPDQVAKLFADDGLLRLRQYDEGEVIIQTETLDCWSYFLISGEVNVESEGQIIGVLRRLGDLFGEWGPLRGRPRSATVTAASDVLCLALDMSLLDRAQPDDPARQTLVDFCASIIDQRFVDTVNGLGSLRGDTAVSQATIQNLRHEKHDLTQRLRRSEALAGCYQDFVEKKGLVEEFRSAYGGEVEGGSFTFDPDKPAK